MDKTGEILQCLTGRHIDFIRVLPTFLGPGDILTTHDLAEAVQRLHFDALDIAHMQSAGILSKPAKPGGQIFMTRMGDDIYSRLEALGL